MGKSEIVELLKEIISIIVIAFVLSMALRFIAIEGRIIPSGSMLPTLQINDRVMINKFIYYFREPQRGDIIVFDPPAELNQEDLFIKRIIGLPGETVEIHNGRVYINGQALKEPYLDRPMEYRYGPVVVPADSLLVLGDNRNDSYDSHRWSVWLTEDRIKGKAFMVYWPLSNLHLLDREVSFE